MIMACLRGLRTAALAPSIARTITSSASPALAVPARLGVTFRRPQISIRPQQRTLAYKLESGMQDIRDDLSDEEKFLFDCNGYIVVKNVRLPASPPPLPSS